MNILNVRVCIHMYLGIVAFFVGDGKEGGGLKIHSLFGLRHVQSRIHILQRYIVGIPWVGKVRNGPLVAIEGLIETVPNHDVMVQIASMDHYKKLKMREKMFRRQIIPHLHVHQTKVYTTGIMMQSQIITSSVAFVTDYFFYWPLNPQD